MAELISARSFSKLYASSPRRLPSASRRSKRFSSRVECTHSCMMVAHIRSISLRRGFTATTRRDKRNSPANDLVKRQFRSSGLNQLWVANMTYVPTWTRFLYLAVVIDVWSRRLVGWSMGERTTADLVLSAPMALTQRKPQHGWAAAPTRTCKPVELPVAFAGTRAGSTQRSLGPYAEHCRSLRLFCGSTDRTAVDQSADNTRS